MSPILHWIETYHLQEICHECHDKHTCYCWIYETDSDADQGPPDMSLAKLVEEICMGATSNFLLNIHPHLFIFGQHFISLAGTCADPSEGLQCRLLLSMEKKPALLKYTC